ncbi:restriction endonuclease subunit S [Flavobacterium ardleyense]|uniref:restriction endonuclease subunit S n=1 Tax=Flavobacterium ardleyense TaxID=2038737 RepID=UPI00298C0BAB|nr:restriction endonuclease subunit S [Flavobacterium ardleyense]
MKSSYKPLSDYIREVKVKNVDLKTTNLLGINIDKYFMPSVANVIGTDMSNYKIVKKNQFACNRMHVGRDKRLPISMSKSDEDFIVSPAYDVFEIIDTTLLLPEYLMMWFTRKKFDRNTWFYTDADVRGGLAWKAFCEMELPIPSIEKQREIVNEYNVIHNRIALNNQLIAKLEETAQAIYKQWFVDFEFPDENGKPYKSNGGEMVFCEELDKEIPVGWEYGRLSELIEVKYGKDYKHLEVGDIPLYGSGGIMSYVNKVLYDKPTILIPRKGSLNNIIYLNKPFWSVDTMFYSILKNNFNRYYVYHFLIAIDFYSLNVGSAVPSMTTEYLNSMSLLKPAISVLGNFDKIINDLLNHKEIQNKEIQKLEDLKELLLARMTKVEAKAQAV